jgi:RimJ/RimL family protein N-acetyltransferase
MKLQGQTMQGRFVRLEPFTQDLRGEVQAMLDADPGAFDLMPAVWSGDGFDGFWAQRMADIAAGQYVSYAIRRMSDGAVVGTSSFLHLRLDQRGVEIGSTVLRPDARGGPVNPETKMLMLGQAFDAGAMRVELVTDLRNLRSQAAIAKLGAQREGVLRQHRTTWTGHIRDTVMFSVLDGEWPAVKAGLEKRLSAYS